MDTPEIAAPTPQSPTTPAVSVDARTPNDVLASMTPAQDLEWRKTGEIPAADAPPAPPVDEGGSDDEVDEPPPVAAQPSTTAPTVSKRQQRINEQIRSGVQAELARLGATHLQPPPAPATPPVAAAPPLEAAPDPNDTDKYPAGQYDAQYLLDAATHRAVQQIRQDQETKAREDAQRAHHADAAKRFQESATNADAAFRERMKADPTFKDRLDLDLMDALIPTSQLAPDATPRQINDLAEELLDDPATAPDVVEYLSTHPEELKRFTSIKQRNQLIRELGRLEGRLITAREPAPPPAPNEITNAPRPPTTLGSRTAAPADRVEAAVRAGDYEAYKREQDARDLAAHRK